MTRTVYVFRGGQVVEKPRPASNVIDLLPFDGAFADVLRQQEGAIAQALGAPAIIRRRNFHVSETLTAEDRERRREPQPREGGKWR